MEESSEVGNRKRFFYPNTIADCLMPIVSPPIIGITGGIGSGKSAVAVILRDLGCEVSNSDEAARAALESIDGG